jgi:serine/threonine-protein kinase
MAERHLTRIGKYEVECVIGEGAMGVVYRAMDPLINRRVAIKVMTEAVAQDAALRERFLREAQAAGSLQHPNVVTIYDFGEVDDHLFIAMEYVEGDDLADLLNKNVPIPLTDALDLIIGLLHGLAFAHKRGIVHRDIKPANIRVDTEGRARLMDFGVAHLASSEMTSTGILLGTPAYMAPEQITGGSVTSETDIFSVGAVLYELLAGRRPFVGDTLQALMYSILNKTPESLETIVPKLPRGLNEIVMRSLNKEPSQRYHSAVVMANDLAAIRTSIDPEGKRTSLSLRAAIDTALAQEHSVRSRRTREWKAAVFGAGVLVAALVIVGGRMLLTRISAAAPPSAPPVSAVVSVPSATPQAAPPTASTGASAPTVSPVQGRGNAPAAPRTAQATPATRADVKTTATGNAPAPAPPARVETKIPDSAPAPVVASVPRVAAPPDRAPAVTQSSATTPVVTPPPSAPAAAPRENVPEQANAVIASYAHALESLDLNELRRVYPAITDEQRRAFSDFFGSVRSLKASLAVSGLQVDGSSAEAQVGGAFDYVTTSGATEHRPVRFVATLRRERGGWTLAAVH